MEERFVLTILDDAFKADEKYTQSKEIKFLPIARHKLNFIHPEKAEDIYHELVVKASKFQKMSKRQYENFMMDAMSYFAQYMFNLQDFHFAIDKSLNTNVLGYANEFQGLNVIFLNEEILKKPKSIAELLENLNTITHEMTHLEQAIKEPATYKKFENEHGQRFRCTYNAEYELLQRIMGPDYKNAIENLKHANYILSPWEEEARDRARIIVSYFAKQIEKTINENKTNYGKKSAEKLLNESKAYVEKEALIEQAIIQWANDEREHDEIKSLKNVIAYIAPDIFTKLSGNMRIIENLRLGRILNIPGICSQETIDAVYNSTLNYIYEERKKNSRINEGYLTLLCSLMNQPHNYRTFEQMVNFYAVLKKYEKDFRPDECLSATSYFQALSNVYGDIGFGNIPPDYYHKANDTALTFLAGQRADERNINNTAENNPNAGANPTKTSNEMNMKV